MITSAIESTFRLWKPTCPDLCCSLLTLDQLLLNNNCIIATSLEGGIIRLEVKEVCRGFAAVIGMVDHTEEMSAKHSRRQSKEVRYTIKEPHYFRTGRNRRGNKGTITYSRRGRPGKRMAGGLGSKGTQNKRIEDG